MKRIKTIGLACTVVLALTAALSATAASASQFRGEAYPVKLDGEQGKSGELAFYVTLPTGSQMTAAACSQHHLSSIHR